MKKLILVIVLAVALLGVLAAPAFAQPQLQDGVYVFIFEPYWSQIAGGQEVASGDPGTALPAGQPVWLFSAWAAYGYGHLKSIGNTLVYSLSIDGLEVVPAAASKALWSKPYRSDATGMTFNPRMRIKPWVAVWLYQVRPGLGAGTYEVTGTETVTHTVTDLFVSGMKHPYMYRAGTTPIGPWELVLP